MNNLKCRKQGFNKYICKRNNKEIKLCDCNNCPYKEYKDKKCTTIVKKSGYERKNAQKSPVYCAKIKKRSSKLAKLERDRFSLFTDDLEHCIICGKSPVNKHEIFYGSGNRQKSMQYGLVIPLCTCEHHNQIECKGIHFNKKLRDEWHIKGQTKFEEVYPDLDFIQIFGRSYL